MKQNLAIRFVFLALAIVLGVARGSLFKDPQLSMWLMLVVVSFAILLGMVVTPICVVVMAVVARAIFRRERLEPPSWQANPFGRLRRGDVLDAVHLVGWALIAWSLAELGAQYLSHRSLSLFGSIQLFGGLGVLVGVRISVRLFKGR